MSETKHIIFCPFELKSFQTDLPNCPYIINYYPIRPKPKHIRSLLNIFKDSKVIIIFIFSSFSDFDYLDILKIVIGTEGNKIIAIHKTSIKDNKLLINNNLTYHSLIDLSDLDLKSVSEYFNECCNIC